ncbi:hypothetical protein Aperf_G00000057337 [Anoplocephala perfoliata]
MKRVVAGSLAFRLTVLGKSDEKDNRKELDEIGINTLYLDANAKENDLLKSSSEFTHSPDESTTSSSEIDDGFYNCNAGDKIRGDLDDYDPYKSGMTLDDFGYPHKYSPVYIRVPESGSILDTMPDIPEKLIHFIAYYEPSLFEYITKNQADPSELLFNMEPEQSWFLQQQAYCRLKSFFTGLDIIDVIDNPEIAQLAYACIANTDPQRLLDYICSVGDYKGGRGHQAFLGSKHVRAVAPTAFDSSDYASIAWLAACSDKHTYKKLFQYTITAVFLTYCLFAAEINSFNLYETIAQNASFSRTKREAYGKALYPTLSLINHSCNPSALVIMSGRGVRGLQE